MKLWKNALSAAGLDFWIYDLRHVFASRVTQAGMGHSSPSILQTYAKAIDEYKRSAITKLKALREAQSIQSAGRIEQDGTTLI
jgi:integrase